MTRACHALDLEAFVELLERFPFERRINSVHLHHTGQPDRGTFRGPETIEAMWREQTQDLGWSDIAQHVTIDPEGQIWPGRSWNRPPASASGFNGTRTHGPFMIALLGNFDRGRDPFDGAQREAAIQVVARVLRRFRLDPQALRFHDEMSSRTCPGSAIDRQELLAAVGAAMEAGAPARRRELPFGDEMLLARQHAEEALRSLVSRENPADDPPTAEPIESDIGVPRGDAADGLSRDVAAARSRFELTPEILEELRPHVIHLEQGRLSSDGRVATTPGDVDALFGEHLPRWRDARREGRMRIVVFAHGGLVSEGAGLRIAHRHIRWWKDNGIYPIYFVWETGLGETIRQLLASALLRTRREMPRDLFDFTTDPLIEAVAGMVGGRAIWSGMKRSAELAAAEGGGARLVADGLREFCKAEDDAGRGVELHGVGHSAGAIFHASFLPGLLRRGGPKLRTLHLLAPAIRVDTFRERLADQIGRAIEHLTLYTMAKSYERADKASPAYRKSLLYLVAHAFESPSKTPLLGLEVSLRDDPEMVRLFGLGGSPAASAEVVWSKTAASTGRSASQSMTHGGFDDDPATMNSVARRILAVGDGARIVDFRPGADTGRHIEPLADLIGGRVDVDWPQPGTTPPRFEEPAAASAPTTGIVIDLPVPETPSTGNAGTGRKRALCVGIDDYPDAPLLGCVADARTWGRELGGLGFTVLSLFDAEATRERILGELRQLVASGRPGDVLVFQYAGHGTQVPDLDGEEDDGSDEAMVPHDHGQGAYLIDDELGAIYDLIPEGVNLTCFIDCCHSGTINRLWVGGGNRGLGLERGRTRQRFLPVTPEMAEAHRRYRRVLGAAPTGRRALGREVQFAACQDHQSAYETDGQGDFTRNVGAMVAEAVRSGADHRAFQRRIDEAFRHVVRQKPRLTCPPDCAEHGLLQPHPDERGSRVQPPVPGGDVVTILHRLEHKIDRLGARS